MRGLELTLVWRERVMTGFRPSNLDIRTDEFRDLVRRSREVVLLAAVTGAITGIGVYFFEYVVTELMLHRLFEADWKWGLIVPGLGSGGFRSDPANGRDRARHRQRPTSISARSTIPSTRCAGVPSSAASLRP